MEHFAPKVVIDGATITPESWMWFLAFALQGIPWAVEEASKPGFKEQIANYYNRKKTYELTVLKENMECELQRITNKLQEHIDGI